MAKGLDLQRKALEADEAKLRARRENLLELERAEVRERLLKSPLAKLSIEHVDALLARLKILGAEEALKRLA